MEIKEEHHSEAQRFAAVIDYWLSGNILEGSLTWDYLAKSLKALNEHKLALTISPADQDRNAENPEGEHEFLCLRMNVGSIIWLELTLELLTLVSYCIPKQY